MPRRILRLVAMLAAATLLAACGSKLTEQNFARIEPGMTEAQVEAILGAPSESSAVGIGPLSGRSSVWQDERATISIQFVNGKVTVKNLTRG